MTRIDQIFLVFMAVLGVAAGVLIVMRPEVREFRVPPYFWFLLAMVAFEAINFARGRGAPGTMVSMEMRLLGFVVAIVAMVVIPALAG